jgi:DNA polymerase
VVWPPTAEPQEWTIAAVEDALTVIATRSLDCVTMFFGSAVLLVQGCIRGLFIASDGHDLIASDYAGIEAVVTAALAGEEWRLEVFRTHGKIYEISASKVTGIPFADFIAYKKQTGAAPAGTSEGRQVS